MSVNNCNHHKINKSSMCNNLILKWKRKQGAINPFNLQQMTIIGLQNKHDFLSCGLANQWAKVPGFLTNNKGITPGSVLEKKLTGGLGLFFWVWNFWNSYFWGFGKISLIFLGLKIFHLFFLANSFDTIYFFGCPIKKSWFAKLLTEIPSNFGMQNNNINEWR